MSSFESMKTTDNLSVVKAWKAGKNARNYGRTLWTHNGDLWSLCRKIGARTNAGVCVVADLRFEDLRDDTYDPKTSLAHIKLAKEFADTIFHELVWESSPLSHKELPF